MTGEYEKVFFLYVVLVWPAFIKEKVVTRIKFFILFEDEIEDEWKYVENFQTTISSGKTQTIFQELTPSIIKYAIKFAALHT